MRIGIHFASFTLPGAPGSLATTLSEAARAADQGGCTTFTLMDHYFQMESLATAQDPMLEGYTSLGFLAGRTETLQLGLLVTGVTYRHRACWPRRSPHSTCCPAVARCSESAQRGTSVSTSASACRSRR